MPPTLATLHPECVFVDEPLGLRFTGHDGARQHYEMWWNGFGVTLEDGTLHWGERRPRHRRRRLRGSTRWSVRRRCSNRPGDAAAVRGVRERSRRTPGRRAVRLRPQWAATPTRAASVQPPSRSAVSSPAVGRLDIFRAWPAGYRAMQALETEIARRLARVSRLLHGDRARRSRPHRGTDPLHRRRLHRDAAHCSRALHTERARATGLRPRCHQRLEPTHRRGQHAYARQNDRSVTTAP